MAYLKYIHKNSDLLESELGRELGKIKLNKLSKELIM